MLLAAVAGAAILPGAAAGATTFTVDSSADPASPDCSQGHPGGSCSLRGAIAAATSGDTVVIAPSINPVLTMGEIPVGQSVTVQGQGARATTVSGNNASRIFNVTSGGLSASGLTLTGGSSTLGGALYNAAGTTSLTDVSVTGNAVASGSAYGGGIINASGATLALSRVTVSGNAGTGTGGVSGAAGGGIFNEGTLTAVNSTISDNTSSGSGSSTVSGGGLYNNGSATLTNVTIASNTVTATGSGAGFGGNIITVGVGASTTLKNTLVAYGTAGSGSNCFAGSGGATVVTQGGNLETTMPSQCGLSGPPAGSDVIGADPLLGPLANNGGQTDTRALGVGSPAIDAVPAANCPPPADDQRQVARPQGPLCDIGAYERLAGSSASPSPPTSPASTPPPSSSTGPQAPPPGRPVGCAINQLVLTDVFPLAGRTHLLGVAPAAAVGKQITILSAWNHKPVAKPRVGADLTFSATVALPPRALRFTNQARYVAQFGSTRSLVLKFARRMYTTAITVAGPVISFSGTVTPPLAKPVSAVVIRASSTCSAIGGGVVVATVKPSPSGAFSAVIRLPASFARDRAVYLRAQTTVRKTKTNKKPFPTFTLIRGITLGR